MASVDPPSGFQMALLFQPCDTLFMFVGEHSYNLLRSADGTWRFASERLVGEEIGDLRMYDDRIRYPAAVVERVAIAATLAEAYFHVPVDARIGLDAYLRDPTPPAGRVPS